jgi:hypothetical protein
MKDDIDFGQHMATVAEALLGKPTSKHGHTWRYGSHGSLSVDIKAWTWFSHEDNKGGGVIDFIMKYKGVDKVGALEFLVSLRCIDKPNGHAEDETEPVKAIDPRTDPCAGIQIKKPQRKPKMEIVAVWPYTDENGAELFEVVRLEDGTIAGDGKRNKDYRQRHKTPDGYEYRVKGIQQVPYALPRLRKGVEQGLTVFVVEGEKCADALIALGAVATTNDGGAKKFDDELLQYFKGADIVILPDNDEAGEKHLGVVSEKLRGVASRVRVLHLPDLPPKGDVADWIAAGGTLEQLGALVDAATDAESDTGADAAKETAPDNVVEFPSSSKQRKTRAKKKVDDGSRKPQASKLIALASEAKLFHTADGTCYADIDINGHRETWKIRSQGFGRWLKRRYHEEEPEGGAPNNDAMSTALGMIEAYAHYDAPERIVHIRIGGADGKIYLDLCDTDWRAVEIDSDGWRIVAAPPIRFRRTCGMRPLPIPLRGGTIAPLRLFLNVRSEEDFILAVSWLLAAFLDHGPYPVLGLAGEHGTGKSTFSAILRAVIDPNTAPLRALPREERDLFIAANNGHVLSFDNVSGLPAWISDGLCRLSTGGGFATRTLHTNDDETLFDSSRPIILNGIEDVISRPDLADRALLLTLEPISKNKRLPQKDVYDSLEKERPSILGALLTAISNGLRRLPDTKLEELPRMADFAIWATACGTDLWGAGEFQAAYDASLASATETIIEADTVATALRSFMADRDSWAGTASELLVELVDAVTESISKDREWSRNGRALSGRLRRAAPSCARLASRSRSRIGQRLRGPSRFIAS